MPSLNKVLVQGHLGRDPEIRQTAGGQSVGNCSVACTEKWVAKDGERKERTEWVRVVAWGKEAEILSTARKGDLVFVDGALQTREWENKAGVKQYTTEVRAWYLVVVPKQGQAQERPPQQAQRVESTASSRPAVDDEIPF